MVRNMHHLRLDKLINQTFDCMPLCMSDFGSGPFLIFYSMSTPGTWYKKTTVTFVKRIANCFLHSESIRILIEMKKKNIYEYYILVS